MDLNSLPEFDFIFSNGVLHHTEDWRRSLKNYLSLIKKAGYLYLYANGVIFGISESQQEEYLKIYLRILPKDP